MRTTGKTRPVNARNPEGVEQLLRQSAHQAVGSQIARGANLYRRDLHLPRLLPTLNINAGNAEPALTEEICNRLGLAVASERRRGQAGHWSYSLNRHIALLQALKAERARLSALHIG